MTWPRTIVILGALSVVAAGLLALYSRTPGAIRNDVPPASQTDADLGATFTDSQKERHAAFRAPGYLGFALSAVLPVIALLVLARGPFAALADRIDAAWAVKAGALALVVTAVIALVMLPIAFVHGFAMQHAWGLSTQNLGDWLIDQAKGLLVGGVIAAVSALAFYGIVRAAPSTWWLWGWAVFSGLTAALAFLYPIAIAPLFNDFTPLDNPALVNRIKDYGSAVGVDIDEVLVADASRRTTAENAYVAGIGPTKRVVVYDTLLESGTEDETAFVVAHELGHRAENHVLKGVALSSAGLLAGFGVLKLLSGTSVWSWAGASGIGDVRALPLLLVFLSLATLISSPIENAISRRFEARADAIALELTDDPDTAVSTFRRLAFKNIADLDPPRPFVWALFTHPPIPERLRAFLSVPNERTNP